MTTKYILHDKDLLLNLDSWGRLQMKRCLWCFFSTQYVFVCLLCWNWPLCSSFAYQTLLCQVCSADQSGMPTKSPGSTNEGGFCNSSEGPLFSRPSRTRPNLPKVGAMRPEPQGFLLWEAEPPQFARPSTGFSQQKELYSKAKPCSSETNGWYFGNGICTWCFLCWIF